MAEDNKKLHIRLHIYDTELAVNINREDEFYYREAAKLINSTLNNYSARYKGRKSDKEIMYMTMIDIALRYETHKGKNDTSAYDEILKTLTGEIDDVLNS